MRSCRSILLIAWLLLSAPALCADPDARAAELFARYQSLAAEFDPAVADLYADDARISNRRTYPNGEVKVLTLDAGQYKALIRAAMPLARSRGDTSTFSEVRYTVDGESVRIAATRYSTLKDYSSDFAMLVGPDAVGQWRILEEHSESRP